MSRADRRRTTAGQRAREAALQMLYQWEVGRVGAHEAIAHLLAGATHRRDARASTPTPLRDVRRTAWCRHHRAASPRSTQLIAAHPQNWRLERMAVIDRLILRLAVYELLTRAGDAGRRWSSTKRSSWRAPSAATRPSAFVNGVLDAVRKT